MTHIAPLGVLLCDKGYPRTIAKMSEWSDCEAIIYARVSDDKDGRSGSVEQQIKQAARWCERYEIPIHGVISDEDIGASRWSKGTRAGYDEVLRLLSEPSPRRRMLVNWESSRAQRQLEVYVELRRICVASGALWSYGGRVYDLTDPEDRRNTARDAVDDEYESERTRKRVLRSTVDLASEGHPHGKPAFGYRVVRDDRSGKPIGREIVEAEAEILREIADRLLSGTSALEVARSLNDRGIAAPRPRYKGEQKGQPATWVGSSITRMMKSPTYIGVRTRRGEIGGSGKWPAILTVEQHERLVAMMNDPARRRQRGTDPVWLLSGIAICGVCGEPMRRRKISNKRTSHDSYCCANNCFSIQIEGVDRIVEEAVLRRLEDPRILQLLSAGDAESADIWAEVRNLRIRLDEAVDAAAEGKLSIEALGRIEARIGPQIKAAERRARSTFRSPKLAAAAGPQARRVWKGSSMADKRDILRAFVVPKLYPSGISGTKYVHPAYIRLWWVGSDDPEPTGPAPLIPLAEGGDPSRFTVDQVREYLSTATPEERERVLRAESRGQGRRKILGRAARWANRTP